MILSSDGISIRSYPTRKEAEAWVKEKVEDAGDGRRYAIEERNEPETIRDVIRLEGIASQDRKLTVNGRPFRVVRTEAGDIDLREV
jgi:hypothetical protein